MFPGFSSSVRVLFAVLIAVAGCLYAPALAAAQPFGNVPVEDPLPPCPDGGAFSPPVRLAIPGDPVAYEQCIGGLPQGEQYCQVGERFSEQAQACQPYGDPNSAGPTVAIDGLYQAGNAIAVKVTYSGTDIGYISVNLTDPTDGARAAGGRTDMLYGPNGTQVTIPITADGQPHDITIPASPHSGPPWILAPGQQVTVAAQIFSNEGVGALPVTQIITAPGPSVGPGMGTWSGNWTDGNRSIPATLTLDSVDPLNGVIDVDGLCDARWTQIQQLPDMSRVVNAQVISGFSNCADNQWNVTVDQNRIFGTDTAHPGSSFTVLKD
jgi:hypothetical protein